MTNKIKMEKQEKKGGSIMIWIALNVVQFVVIIFLAYNLMNQKDEITGLNTELNETESELEITSKNLFSMRDQLVEQKKQYEELGLEKGELDKKIAELDQYIVKLKKINDAPPSHIRHTISPSQQPTAGFVMLRRTKELNQCLLFSTNCNGVTPLKKWMPPKWCLKTKWSASSKRLA